MMTKTTGIVSAPTTATLGFVAAFKRKKAEAKRKRDLALMEREREQAEREREKLAQKWAKPNRPFGQLATVADEFRRKCAEAVYASFNGRLPNGKFASRQQATQDANKLLALGFGGSK